MNEPTKEAVEAALAFVEHGGNRELWIEATNKLWPHRSVHDGRLSETATRILAAEVRRLRGDWSAAITAALNTIPGGSSCDPQQVADGIRELLKP